MPTSFGGESEGPMTESRGVRKSTLYEGLQAKKDLLESQLSEVNRAITALDSEPKVKEILDSISGVASLNIRY